jgi:hypothetical protein
MPPRPWSGGGFWASCDVKPECQATFGVVERAGSEGNRALKFHGEGRGWLGAGFNWTSWRSDLARDVTPFTKLMLRVRVQLPTGAISGLPALSVALASSARDGQTSAAARMHDYEPAVLDGTWHQVTIPLSALTTGDAGPAFDLSATSELRISTWSPGPERFDIYLDHIAVEP